MRVSILLVSLLSIAAVASAALFAQQPSPPWNPRILQGWAFPTSAYTYTNAAGASTTVPAGSYILAWGGGLYNDTYLSTDGAQTWTWVAGTAAYLSSGKVAYNVSSPHPATFNCDDTNCCKAYDKAKNEFYVVDQTAAYVSSNGLDWTTVGGTEFYTRTSAYCFVDLSSTLYVVGGQNTTNSSFYENDIWASSNLGQSFSKLPNSPWSQRDSMAGYVHQSPLGKQIYYAIGGHAKAEDNRPNEVWVSSDSANTWTLLSRGAFAGRDHFGAAITSTGTMLVIAGKLDAFNNAGTSHLGQNDVWASLDGGATWGSCGLAEFTVRQDYRFVIDSNDYLYISGGNSINATGPNVLMGDVWKSVNSWTSVSNVASWCGLTVPACGVGLRCFPNATTYTTGTAPTEQYPIATAAAYSCPCVPTSSSSSTSGGSNGGTSGGNSGAASASASQLSVVAVVAMIALSFVAHMAL